MTSGAWVTGIALLAAIVTSGCGDGQDAVPAPTATPTATPTSTATSTASTTPSATPTFSATATATATPTRTASSTATFTATFTPTDTRTPTPTATVTATPTSTATPNTPPVFPVRAVYRTYPGLPIALTASASDPNSTLQYSSSALPDGAQLSADTGRFEWSPSNEQLGAFTVPVVAVDDGLPPLSAATSLGFKVEPRDSCAIPTCNPATGCVSDLPPLTTRCCTSGPASPRVPEPQIGCPGGRVVHVGRNADSGFGQLHNCDALQAFNSGQIGVTIRFNIEARCFDINTPRQVNARLATDSRVLFNRAQFVNFKPRNDGYGERLFLALPVAGPSPFFDLDHAEADLEVTVIDGDGSTASERVRVVLQFDALGDLEETR